MAEDAPAVPRDPWALQHLKEALDCGSRPLMCLALRRAQEARLEPGLLAQAERYMEEQELRARLSHLAQQGDLHGLREALEEAQELNLDVEHFEQHWRTMSRQAEKVRARIQQINQRSITFETAKCSNNGTWPSRAPEMTAKGHQVLDEVVVVLKEFPGLSLRLEAHSNDSNALRAKALSQQRADAVKEQLRSCGCTNWITTVAWGIGHVIKKKVVRIFPQVDLETPDLPALLQLLGETRLTDEVQDQDPQDPQDRRVSPVSHADENAVPHAFECF